MSSLSQEDQNIQHSPLPWSEKYRATNRSELVGYQSQFKQLLKWLKNWYEQFLDIGTKQKRKKQNDSGARKALLLSGPPGRGKTTSAKLVSQMLGFQAIEVNASDCCGKADFEIAKGIRGRKANSIKELVSNKPLNSAKLNSSKQVKTVLIMDEVDGMSAGDRGGVADLIATIEISKIPIICICNDHSSQKFKSLVNYCLLISFPKPTKKQMAKRLMQIAKAEGVQVDEIALEELAERVNGDMRMALNQLQYMSISMSVIKYDDTRRLLSSSKDQEISPITAVDKLFGFNAGKLEMDERIDLSMNDPYLVPLLVQENYINYRPCVPGTDELKHMSSIARAAESIADGDMINVQIQRYQQWQPSQTISSLISCIIPAALVHGQRMAYKEGRNINRYGGWLEKDSTTGKNWLLEELHVHMLASSASEDGRFYDGATLRLEYLPLILKQLSIPLRTVRMLPKDEPAINKVVEFMNDYSISEEDFDAIVELSKFEGKPNPLEGVKLPVQVALARAYHEGSKTRRVRTADLVSFSGKKKAPKKRIFLEQTEEKLGEENVDDFVENDDKDQATKIEKLQLEILSLNSERVDVQLELKQAKKKPSGRGKGGSATASAENDGRHGSGSGSAKKRRRDEA